MSYLSLFCVVYNCTECNSFILIFCIFSDTHYLIFIQVWVEEVIFSHNKCLSETFQESNGLNFYIS